MGALGTFASGIGSTDLAAALATGELWFKVPESMLFELKGSLPFGVYSKDIILYIISKIGVDGARYQAMEYCGDGLKSLTMEARFTITNMAIEAGGKSGYARRRSRRSIRQGAERRAVYDLQLGRRRGLLRKIHYQSGRVGADRRAA